MIVRGPDTAEDLVGRTHQAFWTTSLDELCLRHMRAGMHVHVASTMSRPNALVYAMARTFAGRSRFTVSANAFHSAMHSLVIAGVVERAITCFAGDTVPLSRPNGLYRDITRGHPFPVEEWSLLSFLQRMVAGATGAPYAVTTSLVASDLGSNGAPSQPAGERYRLIPALRPDLTLVHAHCADAEGNLYLSGPVGEAAWGAMAATAGVLATVEKVCDDAPPQSSVSIPAARVLGMAECPWGAHPQGMSAWPEIGFDGYVDDYAFLEDLASACRDPQTARTWFDRWVRGVRGQEEYVQRLGTTRVAELRRGLHDVPRTADRSDQPASERERHIVLAARRISREIRGGGHRTLLAGIGVSHVASWLAARLLAAENIVVEVVNELGMIGFSPHPGDMFLFSQRHVTRCRSTAGTLDVLGQLVAGSEHTLGVLSAAQVDQEGRINTSRTPSGGFLVGSGGANDVASHVRTVVVAATGPLRYVRSVDFTTSPGTNVACVVAEFGCFDRGTDGAFSLSSWLPDESGKDPESCIRDRTSWDPVIANSVAVESAPSQQELAELRALDVHGLYR